MTTIAHIAKDERNIPTLYVQDKPFFCRAGEIHNSSASDLQYMQEHVWEKIQGLNLNSLIVPVYWELLEPQEDQFDFTLVDGLLEQARDNNIKLILLWFGLWKNSESMYAPHWMKTQSARYWRVHDVNGKPMNIISPFCGEAVEKDAHAFSVLMEHLREVDAEDSTVIAVQVGNEIGVLGSARDYSDDANRQFASAVPTHIAFELGVSGTWREAFGEDAEEQFMAYAYAAAVEQITRAGQKQYELPCYANAWLKQYPWTPGSYPMGGPVPDVHPMWKICAPSLFTLAPDIYVAYCADVIDEYAHDGNPLFIPEIRKDAVASSYALYAFLAKNAICFSPFGIEELGLDPDAIAQPPMDVMIALNIDPSAFDTHGSAQKLAATNHLLEQLEPLYLQYRGTKHMQTVIRHGEYDFGAYLQFEAYDIQIAYSPRQSAHALGCVNVIEMSPDTFLLTGCEAKITFVTKPWQSTTAELLSLQEGEVVNGQWCKRRTLNGDEKMDISLGETPHSYLVHVYQY